MFPLVTSKERAIRRMRKASKAPLPEEAGKRISEPGMFAAYFRYELPDEMFSSVQLALLLRNIERASSQEERDKIYLDTLQSMAKGSLKRDDFLRKLAEAPKAVSGAVAKSLGLSAAKASAHYTYDLMPGFGEAGHVLRLIGFAARGLSARERVEYLRECIVDSTDDTMAFRILTVLPAQKDELQLGVSVADLYPSFADHMRERYGLMVDASNLNVNNSDPWALEYWGRDLRSSGIPSTPEDREIQYNFWRRYIGNSRARLASAFRQFFLPMAAYSTDPTPLVENRISLKDLRRLYQDLPDDPTLTSHDRASLQTLRRLLDGEFKDGFSPLDGPLYEE